MTGNMQKIKIDIVENKWVVILHWNIEKSSLCRGIVKISINARKSQS